MAANPADIAKFTSDGIVITVADQLLETVHPDALDGRQEEIEMFFASAGDGQVLLAERFALLAIHEPVHEMVEIEDRMGLGTDIPLAPVVPSFSVVDDVRDIKTTCRLRGFSIELESDREAVEVIE